MQSSSTANLTTLAVCLSLIEVHDSDRSMDRRLQLLRLNFPGVTLEWIDRVNHDLQMLAPDWIAWLENEQARNQSIGSVLWILEYMKDGGLSRHRLSEHGFYMQGLTATLQDLITLSRRWAVGQGLTRKRSFHRTREDSAFGYLSNERYPSYDHPGNIGY